MKLGEFATINSGVYSSTIQAGDVYYLQARDFDSERKLIDSLSPVLTYSKSIESHFLTKGDVLIVVKGVSFLAAVYHEECSPAVASSVFSVVRIKDEKNVLPEYISWFINLPQTQNHLLAQSKGSAIPSINKKVLLDLIVPVPSIQKQKLILKIAQLREKEKNLYKKMNKLKEIKLNQLIINSLNR
jgi:restriction endonuclease S subunit